MVQIGSVPDAKPLSQHVPLAAPYSKDESSPLLSRAGSEVVRPLSRESEPPPCRRDPVGHLTGHGCGISRATRSPPENEADSGGRRSWHLWRSFVPGCVRQVGIMGREIGHTLYLASDISARVTKIFRPRTFRKSKRPAKCRGPGGRERTDGTGTEADGGSTSPRGPKSHAINARGKFPRGTGLRVVRNRPMQWAN
jgi:hypothetical protein